VELARTFDAMAERTTHIITGLVPICAACKRIRDEDDHWQPVETFVRERSEAEFTHGLCPQCAIGLGFPPLNDVPVAASGAPEAASPRSADD
jgi:hypothetical protein